MNYIQDGYRGLSLLVRLNYDRLLFLGILCAALALSAYLTHP